MMNQQISKKESIWLLNIKLRSWNKKFVLLQKLANIWKRDFSKQNIEFIYDFICYETLLKKTC